MMPNRPWPGVASLSELASLADLTAAEREWFVRPVGPYDHLPQLPVFHPSARPENR